MVKTFRSDKFLFFLFSVFFVTTIGCQENDCQNSTAELVDKKVIYAQNENIIFHGRVDFSNLQAPKIFWPGSGFTLWFEGSSIEVVLDDLDGSNYYNAIIDDDFPNRTVINLSLIHI